MKRNKNLNTTPLIEVGEMIEKLRKKNKITIQHLCHEVGIAHRSYYHILYGKEKKIGCYYLLLDNLLKSVYEKEEDQEVYYQRLRRLVLAERRKKAEERKRKRKERSITDNPDHHKGSEKTPSKR